MSVGDPYSYKQCKFCFEDFTRNGSVHLHEPRQGQNPLNYKEVPISCLQVVNVHDKMYLYKKNILSEPFSNRKLPSSEFFSVIVLECIIYALKKISYKTIIAQENNTILLIA